MSLHPSLPKTPLPLSATSIMNVGQAITRFPKSLPSKPPASEILALQAFVQQ